MSGHSVVSESALDAEFIHEVSRVIKTLGHPDRLRIVELLEHAPMNVKSLQTNLELTQAVTSQHLRQMYNIGIVTSERNGKSVMYRIANPLIYRMLHCLTETQRAIKEEQR